MELSGPKSKNFLIFSQEKVFLIFQEVELSSPKNKKFQEDTFRTQKIKDPLQKKFLYFVKWNFLAPSLKSSYIFRFCLSKEKVSYTCQSISSEKGQIF